MVECGVCPIYDLCQLMRLSRIETLVDERRCTRYLCARAKERRV